MDAYQSRLRRCLSVKERAVFARLRSPTEIQTYVERLPINFETTGETDMSPRRVLRTKSAHCVEGALFAAAALAYHGQKPLLMDLRTTVVDDDHVLALFCENGYWGAISKTNHVILRYRDPVYATPRELAMSYFHEYYMSDGKKTLREYSAPFDLSRFAPERWVIAEDELDWLVEALDDARHFPVVPAKNLRQLRKASAIELRALAFNEWKEPKRRQ